MNQDQWFEDLLANTNPIEDAGFTSRVMMQIPEAPEPTRERNIILGSVLAGFLCSAPFVFRMPTCSSFWLCPPVLIAGFVALSIAGIVLWDNSEFESN